MNYDYIILLKACVKHKTVQMCNWEEINSREMHALQQTRVHSFLCGFKYGLYFRQIEIQIRWRFVQQTSKRSKQNVKGYTNISYMLCDIVEI